MKNIMVKIITSVIFIVSTFLSSHEIQYSFAQEQGLRIEENIEENLEPEIRHFKIECQLAEIPEFYFIPYIYLKKTFCVKKRYSHVHFIKLNNKSPPFNN